MNIIAQKSTNEKKFYIAILNAMIGNKSSPIYQSTLKRINKGEFNHSSHLKNSIKKHIKDNPQLSPPTITNPTPKPQISKEQKEINKKQLEEYLKQQRIKQIEKQMDKIINDPFSNVDVDSALQKIEAKNWYSLFKSQNHMYF